jgi:YidC/Oxa1 family membrane protein insertase
MDKKNFIIGAALLLAAFAVLFFAPRSAPPVNAPASASQRAPAGGAAPAASSTATSSPTQSQPPVAAAATTAAFEHVNREATDATITVLKNDYIEAHFSDAGGALRDVAFIKRDDKNRLVYPARLGSNDPFVFNALHADPMLAFVDYHGLDRNAHYERVSQTATEVVYRAVLDGRLEVTRKYVLPPNQGANSDPYQIRHETTLRNLADQTSQPMTVKLSLGTAAPNNAEDPGLQLMTGYSNGKDQDFIARSKLEASNGFFGLVGGHGVTPAMVTTGSLVWTSVKNQFFTSILTNDQPASGLTTRRVKLFSLQPDEDPRAYGITGAAHFDVKALAPKEAATIAGNLYVGPKEYRRLANSTVFKADQDKVMNFGMFKFFSAILLTLMTWIHGWVQNWGIAIVLTTLSLKTIFIPFTLAASRSAKRMAKLQPELAAIREKYKDNPQKQQLATMELFKERKINPVGGCFPVLITIPFFIGFFSMLQSAAELRFQPFLWAPDLSGTDTVATIWILPLRIMPLLMGATMVVQMHLTPSPSVDNTQAKMMKIMPYIYTFFCYNFSCALSLYSFTNGLFTIGQQLVINKMKDPTESASPGGSAATTAATLGKAMKNVTPHKKK